jgi:predicted house-cleaning noncanonical NTP pyrophosphatase (MazG superfamily)
MSADGKLVRDRIPEIMRASGKDPITYRADREEYRLRLRDKLTEEVDEFLAADNETALEELADVLEVLYALAANLGTDKTQLETLRAAKATQRGTFIEQLVWTGFR